MGLAERIIEVMGDIPPGEFARVCGVSAGAVSQWKGGDVKSLKAEPVAHMEEKFGYRATWVVLGRGPKRITDSSPPLLLSEEVQRLLVLLKTEDLLQVENLVRVHLKLPAKLSLAVNNVQPDSGEDSESPHTGSAKEVLGSAMKQSALPPKRTKRNAVKVNQRKAPGTGGRRT